uniref:TRAP transporter small permease protein n=1 Tax=uncultured Thiotrichaceae bacterium TaxID=298394 RepID=A0A6S6UJE7_9GAMM|nr:MAG: TRAP-type transport system, small permease component, predicted N-acetylneuraminate transporter [uncultured Thiotrichaceae bacterium]
MSAASHSEKSFFDQIEETSIAVCLGLMTLITFANVVARYIFNSNILWALELTVYLFAWLVLMGCSYGVKKNFHIGVDVVINLFSPPVRRILALVSVGCCLLFAILLLIGSWDYWYAFATKQAFYETQDIPMPDFMQFLAVWLNDGEKYEKIPRFLPYLALPLGMALLTFRFAQVAWDIWQGKVDTLIASHEAEEALEEVLQKEGK